MSTLQFGLPGGFEVVVSFSVTVLLAAGVLVFLRRRNDERVRELEAKVERLESERVGDDEE